MKLFTWANLLTLTNLLSGSLACIFFVWTQNLDLVGICLLVSLICDFLDGLVARATGTAGPLGVQLDSLADVVSFGLMPAILMFFLLMNSFAPLDFAMIDFLKGTSLKANAAYQLPLVSFIGLGIVLFSALRLAKFNIDPDQSSYFKGLNTPTNTLALYALAYIQPDNFYLVLGLVILSCFLLVSNIPMFSLKFKNLDWHHDYYLILFGLLCILGLSTIGIPAILYLVGIYILFSLIFRKQFVK